MPLQKSKKKKKKSTKDKDGSVSQNVKQSVVVNVGGGSVDSSKKKKRTGRPRAKQHGHSGYIKLMAWRRQICPILMFVIRRTFLHYSMLDAL